MAIESLESEPQSSAIMSSSAKTKPSPEVAAIMSELEALGTASYKKVMLNHGVGEPLFGVKISELQKIRKRLKKQYELALELYATRNYDAMYLAGLIVDEKRMTKRDLQHWLDTATHDPIASYTVSSVAAESDHGWPLALEWIASKDERTASTGWATLSALVSIKPDADLDLSQLSQLLQRVAKTLHQAPNDVRYAMNGFVIAVGSFVAPLTQVVLDVAERIGRVSVDMGKTECKVPFAPDYIRKVQQMDRIGKKRKTARC
jgi:3-methyladenine DNA glycosylase AlkD